ncbi:hypothetical protein BH24BAC1_BH24BAC1_21840 [soil metagenome]
MMTRNFPPLRFPSFSPFLSLFLLLLLLSACGALRQPVVTDPRTGTTCRQPGSMVEAGPTPQPLNLADIEPALSGHFSFQSLNLAHAMGVLDLLREYLAQREGTEAQATAEAEIRLLRLEQRIMNQINLTSLEISAAAAEVDCEEERADQMGSYLDNRTDQKERRLTVAAISTGALTGIASAALLAGNRESDYLDLIGIGGGIVEVGLGLRLLFLNLKATYRHPRNPLREVYEGPAVSEIFPPALWYFLNYQVPALPEQLSPRLQLILQWERLGPLADARPREQEKVLQLLTGEGGIYPASLLHSRADMLDQLEAQINQMQQHLSILSREFMRLSGG